jgi:hypothetical protein
MYQVTTMHSTSSPYMNWQITSHRCSYVYLFIYSLFKPVALGVGTAPTPRPGTCPVAPADRCSYVAEKIHHHSSSNVHKHGYKVNTLAQNDCMQVIFPIRLQTLALLPFHCHRIPHFAIHPSSAIMLRRAVHHQASLIRHVTGARAISLRVHRGAVSAPANPIHENQRVECTWTIRHGDSSAFRQLRNAWRGPPRVEKLKVLTPGLTIVRVSPELGELLGDDAVARVRISSSSADVLRSVHVAAASPNRARVDFRWPSVDHERSGHLVTEIDLPHANAVRSLAAIGLSDVVVANDVLYVGGEADDEPWEEDEYRGRGRGRHRRRRPNRGRQTAQSLKLLAVNESRLFVDASTTNLRLDTLQVGAWGKSSQVTMHVAGVDVKRSVDVGVGGGRQGGVALAADSLIASRLHLFALGNGDLELAVRRHLEVDDIKSFAVGGSSIVLQAPESQETAKQNTTAKRQAAVAVGSVCVDTGSLSTEGCKVIALGSNDLCLQTRDGLRVRSIGSSVVECVGRIPPRLDVRGLPWPTLVETSKANMDKGEAPMSTDGVQYPTVEEAFENETVLWKPRLWSSLSRWFEQNGGNDWKDGREKGEEGGRNSQSRTKGRRHRSRWAEDQSWV